MANELTRFRGDTYPIVIQIRQNGRLYDLTNCTAALTVSAYEDPTTETPAFTVAGVIASPATSGIVSFTPLATDVDLLGDYYYDVQITDADGLIHTPIKSTLGFFQDITK